MVTPFKSPHMGTPCCKAAGSGSQESERTVACRITQGTADMAVSLWAIRLHLINNCQQPRRPYWLSPSSICLFYRMEIWTKRLSYCPINIRARTGERAKVVEGGEEVVRYRVKERKPRHEKEACWTPTGSHSWCLKNINPINSPHTYFAINLATHKDKNWPNKSNKVYLKDSEQNHKASTSFHSQERSWIFKSQTHHL